MEDTARLQAFLRETPFFGGLEDHAIKRVIGLLTARSFPADAVVFRERDQGCALYVVHDGELVACSRSESGHLARLMRFGRGDFFGETTLIEMQPRPFDVVVERAATLCELTAASLYRLYSEDVSSYVMVLQNINRELCRRLRRASRRVAQFAEDAGEEDTLLDTQLNRHRRVSEDEQG